MCLDVCWDYFEIAQITAFPVTLNGFIICQQPLLPPESFMESVIINPILQMLTNILGLVSNDT